MPNKYYKNAHKNKESKNISSDDITEPYIVDDYFETDFDDNEDMEIDDKKEAEVSDKKVESPEPDKHDEKIQEDDVYTPHIEIGNISENKNINSDEITESSTMDDYIKADFNDKKVEFSESDREKMAEEIFNLREEVDFLKNENANLRQRIQNMELELKAEKPENVIVANNNESELLKKIEKLEFENDELILKNSEIEFEIAKFRETNSRLQSKVDTFDYANKIPKQPQNAQSPNIRTFTNNGYQNWR